MNQSSTPKRFWPTVIAVLVLAAVLTVCLLLIGYIYLPRWVTARLPVKQIHRLGFQDFKGRISSIGPNRTTAGPLIFGDPQQPALSIHSIDLEYTLGELRRKTLRRIYISDVEINVTLGAGGITFPGVDLSALGNKENSGQSTFDGSSSLKDITVGKVEVRSGMVNLSWRNSIYKIPFEADLTPTGPGVARFDARLHLFPRGQLLTVTTQVDLESRNGTVRVNGPAIAIDRFADLLHLVPGLDATGEIAVFGSATLRTTPFTVSHLSTELTWRSGRLTYGSVAVGPGKEGTPTILSAVSEDLKRWQIAGDGLQLWTPVPVAMTALSATVTGDEKIRSVAGDGRLLFLPFSLKEPSSVALKKEVRLPLVFQATQDAAGEWSAGLRMAQKDKKSKMDGLDLTINGVAIDSRLSRFNLSAKGDRQGGTAFWRLGVKNTRVTDGGASAYLPAANGKGQVQFNSGRAEPILIGDARLDVPAPTLDGHGLSGKLDTLTLTAQFKKQGSAATAVETRIRCPNGDIQHEGTGLRLAGLRLDIPFTSSLNTIHSNGTFSVSRITHKQRVIGKIDGRITQKKDAYTFAVIHDSTLFPGLSASMDGTTSTRIDRFPDTHVTFQIPPYNLPAKNDLGRLYPAAKGMILAGTVSAQGKGGISSTGLNGTLDVSMKDGSLKIPDKNLSVENIDTTFRFPDLPRLRSAPAQHIRFSRAALGGITVDGGTFDVQVESEKTIFVEKGQLSWCGGKVDAQSLRITAGEQNYNVTLYCQRLGLTQILEQLGAVNARGTGTVNGRIPIAYSNGNIQFDDGFLFSTPGEAGQIQLSGTEILTRGIPAGTPQFAQVELAQEALKDYAYTWAKLGLVSEGEDFVMRLQFDGKPINPLPFIYKKEIGSFVRVEAGAQGSVFQGIGLDVNLRLPLNQLLQYKDIVNMIQ